MRTPSFVALLIFAAAVPQTARAAKVQMTSSTQYLWYNDFLSQGKEDQQDVAEYLKLSATLDEKEKISVLGYGRIIGQLTTSVEPRNGFSDDVIGRLYYVYLDYRDILGHLDLRAGRTFVGSGAIPGIVDGGQLTGRNLILPGLGATAFGGRRVFLDNKSEVPFDDDYLMGGSVFFDAARLTRAEVSYARDYQGGNLGREFVALDVTTTPTSAVGLIGRVKYDLVSSRANELVLGVKVAPIERLVLRAEYYDSVPTFESWSFYRHFGVEHYRQASLAGEWRIGAPLKLLASYAYERFDADETANLFGVGFSAHLFAGLFLDATYEHRTGYAGGLDGIRAKAWYTLSRATLLAGADYDDFKRQDSREDNARKYWAGLDFNLNKTFAMAVRAERNENFLFDVAYQGFVRLDIHL